MADWLGSRRASHEDHFGFPLSGHDILARLLLARDEAEEALLLLERLIGVAQTQERETDLIHLLLLKVKALHSLNRESEATPALRRALELAEPQGHCRSFVDLGPGMQTLLQQRASVRTTPYLAALLAGVCGECPPTANTRPDPERNARRRGVGQAGLWMKP